jgi:hypothetical protein
LKIPHLPAWLFRGFSADFSQLTPSIRWQARFSVIIISKSRQPSLASLQGNILRLREGQAQDWDSRYGETSMVFDRNSGVGPAFC